MKKLAGIGLAILALEATFHAAAQTSGPEFRVNSYTTFRQLSPRAVVNAAGGFVVAWDSRYEDGSEYGIFMRRFDEAGAPQGSVFRVNTYTTDAQAGPVVALGAAGGFVVVWTGGYQDPDSEGVFGQRLGSTGNPLGGEFRVNTHATGAQRSPALASDSAGSFVVVWESYGQDGDSDGIFGQRFDSAGGPRGGEFRVNAYTTGIQDSPAVASEPSGAFVVMWVAGDADGDGEGILGQRFSNTGAPLAGAFRVNTYSTHDQSRAAVAYLASGDFVVLWESGYQDGSERGIFAQRFTGAGAPLGLEFRVNTYTTATQTSPSAAADSPASFVVVWASDLQDGGYFGIFGQRFSNAGSPIGLEFRVNTYTTTAQESPDVASNAAGQMVVVWWSEYQDGDGTGVYGQRNPHCPGGDTNADGKIDVSDILYLINHIFASGPFPACGGDANRDGKADVLDVLYLINYLFAGGPPPG